MCLQKEKEQILTSYGWAGFVSIWFRCICFRVFTLSALQMCLKYLTEMWAMFVFYKVFYSTNFSFTVGIGLSYSTCYMNKINICSFIITLLKIASQDNIGESNTRLYKNTLKFYRPVINLQTNKKIWRIIQKHILKTYL